MREKLVLISTSLITICIGCGMGFVAIGFYAASGIPMIPSLVLGIGTGGITLLILGGLNFMVYREWLQDRRENR